VGDFATTVVPGSDAVEEAVDELVGHDVSLHHHAIDDRPDQHRRQIRGIDIGVQLPAGGGRLEELITSPDPAIAEALTPVRDSAVDNPQTALGWLSRSRGAELLGRIARGELPLTHADLDAQPPGMSIEHLRRMLVSAGALPERNEHLARLEHFATTLLNSVKNAEDQRILFDQSVVVTLVITTHFRNSCCYDRAVVTWRVTAEGRAS
jgi:hypothetical protein